MAPCRTYAVAVRDNRPFLVMPTPMTPNANEVQERLTLPAEPHVRRDQALAAAGVCIPIRRDAAPFRAAGPRRLRWYAFILRLIS